MKQRALNNEPLFRHGTTALWNKIGEVVGSPANTTSTDSSIGSSTTWQDSYPSHWSALPRRSMDLRSYYTTNPSRKLQYCFCKIIICYTDSDDRAWKLFNSTECWRYWHSAAVGGVTLTIWPELPLAIGLSFFCLTRCLENTALAIAAWNPVLTGLGSDVSLRYTYTPEYTLGVYTRTPAHNTPGRPGSLVEGE